MHPSWIKLDSYTSNPANLPCHPSIAALAASSVPDKILAVAINPDTSGDTTKILLSIGTSFLLKAVLSFIISADTVSADIVEIVITWLEWAVKNASIIVMIELSTVVSIPFTRSWSLLPLIE